MSAGDRNNSKCKQGEAAHGREITDCEHGTHAPDTRYDKVLVTPQKKYDPHRLRDQQVSVKPDIIKPANEKGADEANCIRHQKPEDM